MALTLTPLSGNCWQTRLRNLEKVALEHFHARNNENKSTR